MERRLAGLAGLLAALAAAGLASLALGSRAVPLHDVVGAFTAFEDTDAHVIVRDVRGPRTLVGIAVGAALAAAGALIQGATRNPLADPGVLGISGGAALAVVCAIFLLGVSAPAGYVPFALLGATGAGALVYALGRSAPVNLALAGAAMAALCVALTSAVVVLDSRTLDDFRFWVAGSIAGRDLGALRDALPFLVAGLALALACGRALNTLSLGDDLAAALGQRVALARGGIAAGFILLAGAAVAVAGPIAFVGLTVPHAARALVGPDYRWIVPYSAVLGAILLLAADVLGRLVASPGELPVGIVMAAIGAPVFVALVRRRSLAQL